MDDRLGSWMLVAGVALAAALAVFGSRPTTPPSVGREDAPAPFEQAEDPFGDPDEPAEGPRLDDPAQAELPPNHPPIARGDSPAQSELPPNHPPIQSAGSPQGSELAPANELPAITWRVPRSWRSAPNASAMRLATYHVPPASGAADEAELTVVRAGGSTEANITRWLGQFDDAGHEKRTERAVHGMKVTIVEVGGTFTSGGMTPTSTGTERHTAWALLGAIVETDGLPYFFKLLGPAATLRAARADFQTMIDGIAATARGSTL